MHTVPRNMEPMSDDVIRLQSLCTNLPNIPWPMFQIHFTAGNASDPRNYLKKSWVMLAKISRHS